LNGQLHQAVSTPAGESQVSSDEWLVKECLHGNEQAWADLIHKYRNLIFSIPIRYGVAREDAADIFQAVCLELFSKLVNLRKAGSLCSWLITVTTHQVFHWKKKHRVLSERETVEEGLEELAGTAELTPSFLEAIEREQTVRDAVRRLSPRCGELVRLLFYEHPPVPYSEVAQRLGLASGSIGFIRGRCLRKLQRILEDAGL
jgi:RNA polymerase sigma factor (sigma-70 family)